MTLFEELRQTALLQHEQGDFPSWLLDDVLEIVSNSARYADREQLIVTLITQIGGYDPYAGAGCFAETYGVDQILRTVQQLRA